MGNPIISVIIPVYNEEKYIDRCMESLQQQSYRNLQIILINGGSLDASPKKCDEWAKHWNMGHNSGIVEVIHTANNGVSASRNLGLAHASGEYVTFIDGDDWLDFDAINTMYKSIREEDSDLVGIDFTAKTSVEDASKEAAGAGAKSYEPAEFVKTRLLNGDVHCWGRLYKRELIGKQRFKEGLTIGEDMLFFLEYVLKCRKITSLDYAGYNYFTNPGGAMGRPYTPAAYDQVLCWQEAGKMLERFEDPEMNTAIQGNVLISVMLTAGRIAFLDAKERKKYTGPKKSEYGDTVKKLKAEIKENKNRASKKRLSFGYRLKICIFTIAPKFYLWLYHFHKA